MRLDCPHCHNTLDLPDGSLADGVLCPTCGSSIQLEQGSTGAWSPPEGRRRLGRFELIETVGVGAFGTVYKARDPELDRVVAIKVPRAGTLSDSKDLNRFLREARNLAHLRHPSIVSVYDVGQSDSLPYLVSEFVEGLTLADVLTARRPSPRDAAKLVANVADALQYAHDRGVIHRDVKPSNILIDDQGAPHVMDFGLARSVESSERESGEAIMTVEGQLLGTPAYMSPEQARGEAHQVDGRSDIYSLGVILFQLLTGDLPFRGNARMLLHQVLHDDPPSPRSMNRLAPKDLETICLKAMAKEPKRRYATASGMAQDLRRFLNGEPIKARPVGLVERSVKWVRRRPAAATLIGLAGLTLLLSAAGGLWYWDKYFHIKVEYYANVVKRWGVLEGVGQVSAEQARHRKITYKFHQRAGQVESIEVVNGSGVLTPHHRHAAFMDDLANRVTGSLEDEKHECRYEYRRNEKGQVTDEVAFDRAGQVVWSFHYTTPTTGHFTDPRGFPRPRAGSGATYVEFLWSNAGFEKEVHYLDRNGKRRPANDRTYGIRQVFDSLGLPVERTYLGAQYQPIRYKDGTTTVRMLYDDQGNESEEAFFGPDAQPVLHEQGYAKQTFVYNERGNLVEKAYFGLNSQPILTKEGCARITYAHDDRGNATEWAFWGLDGKLTRNNRGYARVTNQFDSRGKEIEWNFFDPAGKPTRHRFGQAKVVFAYDQQDNRVEMGCFGPDGKPTIHQSGFFRLVMSYDDRGNVIETSYFGLEGKPIRNLGGYAKHAVVFDDLNNDIEESYFDPDGKPARRWDGIAKITFSRDDRGNIIEQGYFGPDGKPTRDQDGYARITMTYDEQGNKAEEAYFGPDGKRTLHMNGYASVSNVHDARGNLIEKAFFDLEGKPALNRVGVAKTTWRYDERDDLIEEAFSGLDGKPKANIFGIASYQYKHDLHGNQIEEAFFEVDGKPKSNSDGFAKVTRKFDRFGNGSEEAYFGADGKPTLQRDGYAKITWVRDDRSRITQKANWGLDGKLALDNWGLAKASYAYDDRGNAIEETYHDRDGKPKAGVAKRKNSFDDRGNLMEESYWGPDDRPAMTDSGLARLTRVFNNRGNVLQEAYFGVEGHPVVAGFYGCARMTAVYDDRSNRTEVSYFGPDGKPWLYRGAFARSLHFYDDSGRQTGALYFGAEGEPVQSGFIRDWLILAPIPLDVGESGGEGLAKAQLQNEANLQPKEGTQVTVGGTELAWKKYRAPEYLIDFADYLGRQVEYATAYAVCYLNSDEDQNVTMKVGSDDQAKVYLNGQEVYSFDRPRPLGIDTDSIPNLTLKKGPNVLVVKIVNEKVYWQVCVRFADAEGHIVQNLTNTLREKEDDLAAYRQAVAAYRHAAEVEPKNAEAHAKLGIVLAATGDLVGAVVEYRKAIELDSKNAMTHVMLGNALRLNKDLAGAAAAYRKAIDLDPKSPETHNRLSLILMSNKDLAGASAEFRQAVSLDPKLIDSSTGLLHVLQHQGRLQDAQVVWERALETNPADHGAWMGYAELCLYLGKEDAYRRARQGLLKRFGDTNDPVIAERTAKACLLLPGMPEETKRAVALADRALLKGLDHGFYPYFQLAKGMAEYRSGRLDKAVEQLQAALSRGNAESLTRPARLILAMAQHRWGKKREALQALESAVVGFDWREERAQLHDTWISHVLRREAEALMMPNLSAFLKGDYQPPDNNERLLLATASISRKMYLTTTRLYASAMVADPKLVDEDKILRYNAACCAALAGCAQGSDAAKLDDKERATWRKQAVEWLKADLAAYVKRLASGKPEDRNFVQNQLRLWRSDSDLAGIRDPQALAKLSPEEQESCRKLWSDVTLFLTKQP